MIKVVVRLGGAVVNEIEFEKAPVTIGRNPDNDLRIENLAVSGRHARVEKDGDGYRLLDLQSTNGTYVNDRRVERAALRETDVVTVGKHALSFLFPGGKGRPAASPGAAPATAAGLGDLDRTMVLDTRSQREREEREAEERRRRQGGAVGVLTVLQGAADRTLHELTRDYTLIGKDPDAGVRLKGLLVPKVAGFVVRDGEGYALVPPEAGGVLRLNGQAVGGRARLKDGDTIEVRGASLRFGLRA